MTDGRDEPSSAEHPPEPPPLAVEDVDRLIAWTEQSAAWLRADQAEAARHGHPIAADDRAGAAFLDAVALLFREAYGRL